MKKAFRPRISAGLVLSTALALFNLGLFALLILAGSEVQKKLREEFEVQVFMDREVQPEQISQIGQKITASRIAASDASGKPGIRLVSREEAGKRFIAETGENFMEFLGENPLRDAYHIRIREQLIHPDSLSKIRLQLAAIPGIFEVYFIENLAGSMEENFRKAGWIFLIAGLILLISVYWLLNSSIQAAVYSGRFFIRSMELLGASPWFIRRPYVLAIGLGGLFGGLLAAVLLASCLIFLIRELPETAFAFPIVKAALICAALVPAGFLMCFLPALNGIRAYQQKKSGELYAA
jgi:cell division transport system permease protein